ncbi:energy-coupling factor ABC transporter ATP-binding protein [uncultured Agrococcus sp.]|uniref:energy-coupling factor ABC transporter ATP-binding protein n=1 Tax=uncultured Agrococcus sp. TaxID=382258 RepID=UPI0025E719DA|nr:energy-coupling factor ABC transporter ATP-binding protein [uncultured Agrococcus sp.]
MIRFENVSVTAQSPEGAARLLHNVSFELTAARTAIIGENGSGKTTLARALGGLVKPSSGRVIAPENLGYLFSNPGAQPIMPTVREDVALSLRGTRSGGRKLRREEIDAKVNAALAEHSLTEFADRPCHSLSSGQQQRLALCSILVAEPDLVIADEPTSLLDARHRRIVADRLLSPAAERVVLVTHDLDLASRCDQALLVQHGRVTAQGTAVEIIDRYERSLV